MSLPSLPCVYVYVYVCVCVGDFVRWNMYTKCVRAHVCVCVCVCGRMCSVPSAKQFTADHY